MGFNTEKNKLDILWNQVNENENVIIKQKDDNTFIVDNINGLNNKNSVFPVLSNFSSDWIFTSLEGTNSSNETIVDGSFAEFRLIFKNVDPLFIPYIHCEILFRSGESGVIPLVDNPNPSPPDEIPFDENLANILGRRLRTNEIFQINESDVEYISSIVMDFEETAPQEVEFKFVCYILNPHYYQAT